MYQVPSTVWNQIDREQRLATPLAKRLFPLQGSALDKALEAEIGSWRREGVSSPSVRVNYSRLWPLLWERRAISAFLVDHPELATALPTFEDVGEALIAANNDSTLSEPQQQQLRKLLEVTPA
jgi:hypothetical protein